MARKPTPVKIWNQWDDFGLLNGLGHWSEDGKTLEYVRYPGENNKQLRDRLKQSRKYPGNSTVQGMLNNISRDLGISVSGAELLPRYNTQTKTIFHLSEAPYPGASGVRVYVSASGDWASTDEVLPQVRASGYADAVSGWIVWNLPDSDPGNIPAGLPGSEEWYNNHNQADLYSSGVQYGEYTRILEFIGTSVPDTDDRIKVDYVVKTSENELGSDVLNWRSDFSDPDNPDDERFVGLKSELPSVGYSSFVSGHVAIYSAIDLINSPVSGYFYDGQGRATSRLLQLKKVIDDEYPLTWGKFKLDIGRWDQLEMASIGNIPSFHSEDLPSADLNITHTNGSRYGVDLDMVGVELTGENARDAWYPKFEAGEFYIDNNRFYLFAKMRSEHVALSHLGNNIYSGVISASGTDMPAEFDMIVGMTSGQFYNDATYYSVPSNPYIKQIHEYSNPNQYIFHRTPYVDTGSGVVPSLLDYDNGQGFYYDYDNGNIYASGAAMASGMMLVWEDSTVDSSGLFLSFSGGYGFASPNLNPLANPFDKVFFFG